MACLPIALYLGTENSMLGAIAMSKMMSVLMVGFLIVSDSEQQAKTALGVAARGDMVIIVDMIIKAERYFAWKVSNSVGMFRVQPTARIRGNKTN